MKMAIVIALSSNEMYKEQQEYDESTLIKAMTSIFLASKTIWHDIKSKDKCKPENP